MNDQATERIAFARRTLAERPTPGGDGLQSDRFPDRVDTLCSMLAHASYLSQTGDILAWMLVAETYCNMEDVGEPCRVRQRGPLVDRVPAVFRSREPLLMLAASLGLPEVEREAAWAIVGGAYHWLIAERDALKAMERG